MSRNTHHLHTMAVWQTVRIKWQSGKQLTAFGGLPYWLFKNNKVLGDCQTIARRTMDFLSKFEGQNQFQQAKLVVGFPSLSYYQSLTEFTSRYFSNKTTTPSLPDKIAILPANSPKLPICSLIQFDLYFIIVRLIDYHSTERLLPTWKYFQHLKMINQKLNERKKDSNTINLTETR